MKGRSRVTTRVERRDDDPVAELHVRAGEDAPPVPGHPERRRLISPRCSSTAGQADGLVSGKDGALDAVEEPHQLDLRIVQVERMVRRIGDRGVEPIGDNRWMINGTIRRVAAFTDTPSGGNPAGVWMGATLPDPGLMQRIATEIGFSETAFVSPEDGSERTVRYYSPEAEVSFCGHATIATGVVLGETAGDGTYPLHTPVGLVPVTVITDGDHRRASLTSVEPTHVPAPNALLDDALDALGWAPSHLDPSLLPVRAYAGAWHLVLAVAERWRLADLDYAFDRLKQLMLADGLTTLQLVWRADPVTFHSRNPFPVGGVVEDPATGAAAAALGGYLRDAGLIAAPARLTIHQGHDMGRPSLLEVDVPPAGGIVVTGTAVDIE